MVLNRKTTCFPVFGRRYFANSMHRCRVLTFASARLSCISKSRNGSLMSATGSALLVSININTLNDKASTLQMRSVRTVPTWAC